MVNYERCHLGDDDFARIQQSRCVGSHVALCAWFDIIYL